MVGYNFSDSLYEASCLVVEKGVVKGREGTGGRVEAGDVVVGRLDAVAGRSSRGHDESSPVRKLGRMRRDEDTLWKRERTKCEKPLNEVDGRKKKEGLMRDLRESREKGAGQLSTRRYGVQLLPFFAH
jgi:hypothetical protein